MLSFGGKKHKNAFFFSGKTFFFQENIFLNQIFKQFIVHLTEEILKTLQLLKRNIFYEFLKNLIFLKLTTDFDNRTKRHAETKECVFLDMDH